MRERAFRFGSQDNLVGILCEPDGGAVVGRPAVLMSNVGLNHRVGPYRLFVDLARRLADRGFASLRFDSSGLGDSAPREGADDGEVLGAVDLREAMTFLERKRAIRRFVIVAICSGVDPAHVVGLTDPRVAGVAFLDGYAYATLGHHLRQGVARVRGALRPGRWYRWILRHALGREDGLFEKLPGFAKGYAEEWRPAIYDRVYPPVERFRSDLETMQRRGLRLLFLYTGEALFFSSAAQFPAMLDAPRVPPGVEVEYWRETDHGFTAEMDRRRVVARLVAWTESHFAGTREAGAKELSR